MFKFKCFRSQKSFQGLKYYQLSPDRCIDRIFNPRLILLLTPEKYLNLITLGVGLQLNLILCAVTTFTVLQISKLLQRIARKPKIYKMSLEPSLRYESSGFGYHHSQFISPESYGRQYHGNFMVS